MVTEKKVSKIKTIDIKSIFDKLGCPYILKLKGDLWFAMIHLTIHEYSIEYINDDWLKPLKVKGKTIEGSGATLEYAINELKQKLKLNKLIE